MAVNATAVWRVRPSGSNTNGGGFDCSISPAASGTAGSWSTTSGTTTFTDASASFTSGMVGSAINILGLGQISILSLVDATHITIALGNLTPATSNFGSNAIWTVGGGMDYSQQDSAQASGVTGTASGTTTFTEATAVFTAAMVGNALQIASGAGFTAGVYFVAGYTNSTTITLDRSPGTGTAAVWALGGGWADFWTKTASSGPLVGGNTVYILGGASPSYASPDYTMGGSNAFIEQGTVSTAPIIIASDSATPATNGYQGRPLINGNSSSGWAITVYYAEISNLYIVVTSSSRLGISTGRNYFSTFRNIVVDMGGYLSVIAASGPATHIGCEYFNGGAGSTGVTWNYGDIITLTGCNIHDITGTSSKAINIVTLAMSGTIIANCTSGLVAGTSSSSFIFNCVFDGASLYGIQSTYSPMSMVALNNIFSNCGTAVSVASGSAGARSFIDYNTYYNNVTNISGTNAGPHDIQLSSDPYVDRATQNFTLA